MPVKRTGFEKLDAGLAGIQERVGSATRATQRAVLNEITRAYRRRRREIPSKTGDLAKALTSPGAARQFFRVDASGYEFGTTLRQGRFVVLPAINLRETKIVKTIAEWVTHGA